MNRAITSLNRLHESGKTNTVTAMRFSHELLAQRSEARKVLFVITDGRGDEVGGAHQIGIGERLGVTTIGLGIGVDISHTFGSNSVTVKKAMDIGNVAFKHIKLAA